MTGAKRSRQKKYARQDMLGAWAELEACRELRRLGYEVVQRNVRCKSGELDIVARDGEAIAFVEVRSRRGWGADVAAADSVGPRKRLAVRKAAARYLFEHGLSPDSECRFDVVLVSVFAAGRPPAVLVIKDAF